MIEPKGMRWIVAVLAAASLCGCRVKGLESFRSAVSPTTPSPGKADPYTYGGIAEGTGGQQAKTSYASDSVSPDPLSRTETGKAGRLDQPRVAVSGTANPAGNSSLTGSNNPPQGQ